MKTMKYQRIRGFSLMELLAVMAIMGILSTMAITGYFSAVRGMTRRRAVYNLVAALSQARQRASIDGTRTALVCYNVLNSDKAVTTDTKTFSPTYVICKALGRVTYFSGAVIGDEFTPLDKIFGPATSSSYSFGSRRLYNLSTGRWSDINDTVKLGAYGPPLKSGLTGDSLQKSEETSEMLWCFTKVGGTADWKVGDLYGIEVSPPGILPKNIYFDYLGADDQKQIILIFLPDGSVEGTPSTSISLTSQDGTVIATLKVQSDGSVTGGKDVILK